MYSKCERCGGLLQGWDERVFATTYYGGVRAMTCNVCHNDIVRLIETHPRWPEVGESDKLKALSDHLSQDEIDARMTRATDMAGELRLFFHDYVRSLLPYQVKASETEPAAMQ